MTELRRRVVRPETRFEDQIEGMLNAMTAIQVSNITYVACPITGGYRHLEWRRSSEKTRDEASHRSHVISPNVSQAGVFCGEVSSVTGKTCINPAVLFRPSWNQDDYRNFWSRVIEKFATDMYLSEGWEVSVGCLFECLLAIQLNIPIYNCEMRRLGYQQAIELAIDGAKALNSIGDGSAFLSVLVDQFNKLRGSECRDETAQR
jgi:hypothetical protein